MRLGLGCGLGSLNLTKAGGVLSAFFLWCNPAGLKCKAPLILGRGEHLCPSKWKQFMISLWLVLVGIYAKCGQAI